jgi:hypothetical protein
MKYSHQLAVHGKAPSRARFLGQHWWGIGWNKVREQRYFPCLRFLSWVHFRYVRLKGGSMRHPLGLFRWKWCYYSY